MFSVCMYQFTTLQGRVVFCVTDDLSLFAFNIVLLADVR